EMNQIRFQQPAKNLNLSKEEHYALRNIQKGEDIIVRSADKGGAVVVWSKDLYIKEANRQLSESNFHTKVPDDLTQQFQTIVISTIENAILNKQLPGSAYNLIVENPHCSRFYLLPKIHKQNNPGRPIVSACSCPTEFISKFLGDTLRHIVESLSTYVKDSIHF
uniref:Uncharacterized protein n=1 Tax=Latimeria chalumnae TaxID=7897 RepID=H3B8U1_LATCH